MPRSLRGKGRILAALAIVALVAGQVGNLQAQRVFADCILTCTGVKQTCKSACKPDCNAIFPPGPERGECKTQCSLDCETEDADCKLVCQEIKNPPSPEEP